MVTSGDALVVEGLVTWLATGAGVVAAVDDVSFSVGAGRTLGLVGESGSGKSLTCLSIMRLLPQNGRNGGGKVWLDGEDLLAKTPRQMSDIRGRDIGMVLQDPMTSLNPLFTIGAQMDEAALRHSKATRREARERTLASLRAVRIPASQERVRAYPHQLSGGMRQRVSIGMNVASAPKVLICDEPTTALDVTVQLQILGLLRDMQRATGMAIILVTHDLSNVAHFCDDVAVMYGGRIVESGPVAEVFARPGHPYTEGLLRAMPSIDVLASGAAPPDRLDVIPGQAPSLGDLPPACRFAPRCGEAEALCRTHYPDWFTTSDDRRRVACWHTPERMR